MPKTLEIGPQSTVNPLRPYQDRERHHAPDQSQCEQHRGVAGRRVSLDVGRRKTASRTGRTDRPGGVLPPADQAPAAPTRPLAPSRGGRWRSPRPTSGALHRVALSAVCTIQRTGGLSRAVVVRFGAALPRLRSRGYWSTMRRQKGLSLLVVIRVLSAVALFPGTPQRSGYALFESSRSR